jgi:hypothetical protein
MTSRIVLVASLAALALGAAVSSAQLVLPRAESGWIGPGGRSEIRVAVTDEEARPVSDLTGSDFSLEVAGRTVAPDQIVTVAKRSSAIDFILLADAALLQPPADVLVRRLATDLARDLPAGGQVTLVRVGQRLRTTRTRMDEVERLFSAPGSMQDAGAGGRLLDALHEAIRGAQRVDPRRPVAIVVLTRALESGSRHDFGDLVALGAVGARPVPIFAVVIEGSDLSPEAARLARLCARCGGSYQSVASADALPDAARRLWHGWLGSYVLSFRVPKDVITSESVPVAVTVAWAGVRQTVRLDVVPAERDTLPWWRQPAPWLWLGTIVVVGGALAIWRRPRRLFDLVVENGVEAGCSYEVYQLPVRLGAADGNDITFVEVCVSRNHAVLECRGSVIEIVDLNSENGTFVNGERVSRQRLVDGDEISLGVGLDLFFEGRG